MSETIQTPDSSNVEYVEIHEKVVYVKFRNPIKGMKVFQYMTDISCPNFKPKEARLQ